MFPTASPAAIVAQHRANNAEASPFWQGKVFHRHRLGGQLIQIVLSQRHKIRRPPLRTIFLKLPQWPSSLSVEEQFPTKGHQGRWRFNEIGILSAVHPASSIRAFRPRAKRSRPERNGRLKSNATASG